MSSQSEQTYVALRSRKTQEWFVHPDLRTRMVADAQERGTSLTDLTVLILCEHFKVPYTPNVRKSQPEDDKGYLMLRLPVELERAIGAVYPRGTAEAIRITLSAHYDLDMPAKVKQTRTRAPRPAAAT